MKELEFSWWQPKDEGEAITGKVSSYGADAHSKFNDRTIKLVDQEIGKSWGRGVSGPLENALSEAQVVIGDVISIIYRGKRTTKSGSTTYNRFDVCVHERAPRKPADSKDGFEDDIPF
jgi:hypothetical protein